MSSGSGAATAAVLARQRLEEILISRTAALVPGLQRPTTRSRLILLRELDDPETGNRAQIAWDGLSRACHHHSFELHPTAAEVRNLVDLVAAVASRCALD